MKKKIVTVEFNLKKKVVKLSPEEAREIYDQLRHIFCHWPESPLVVRVIAPGYPTPNLVDSSPERWPAPYHTEITCDANGRSTLIVSG